MRSDAKASSAGSSKRRARGLGRIFRGALATRASTDRGPGRRAPKARRLALPTAVLAAIVAALVLLAGLADAATSAITEPATNIGGTHATLNGVVNPEGVEPEECFFEWTQSSSFGAPSSYTETTPCAETPAEIGTVSSPVPVHADITGLEPQNTRYHFRLVVVDPSETVYGADKRFNTLYDVVTEEPTSNTGTRATLAGTVNPEGTEPEECFFEWGETSSYGETVACAETIGSGSSPVSVHADITGLAPQGTSYRYRLVVVVSPSETLYGSNKGFNTPNTVITEAASGVTPTEATLNGSVNPDTETISECLFEWGQEKTPLEDVQEYPETAPCVPGPGSITGESPVPVEAGISGLHPGTTYVYRLKAAYPTGPATGSTLTVRTAGPAVADSWSQDVVYTEGTLKAEINPEGAETSYHFEYGPTTAYGAETAEATVGSDSSTHQVSAFLEGLTPGTEYHWRVVATSSVATNEGPDHTMRTFRPFTQDTSCPNQVNRYGAGANLPDCRAYEMVSPLDKNGTDIKALGTAELALPGDVHKSTPSGDKLTYSSYGAFADAKSVPWTSQYIAQRRSDGWQTHSINPPQEENIGGGLASQREEYWYFSDDLCQAWMKNLNEPPLSPGGIAGIYNIYRHEDRLCGPERFEAVAPVTAPAGTEFQGASADGSHAIFTSNNKLAPEGSEGKTQLYESLQPETSPRLVCILPGGSAWTGTCAAGSSKSVSKRQGNYGGAISADGERIFWTATASNNSEAPLYVRIGGAETLPVSEAAEAVAGTSGSFFWGAATDGSRAVFTTGGAPGGRALYAFDVVGEATEPIAEGVYGVMGISQDARRVYFVSGEALAGAAVEGRPNLYFYEAGGTTKFIATLAEADVNSVEGPISLRPYWRYSRVAPDGLHAAFASDASLTGYDNRDLRNGVRGREAFVYDATSGSLLCASCSPSGARDRQLGGSGTYQLDVVPSANTALLVPRALSANGGRLFFESTAALDPRDTNGKVDVYEWEALGAGSCDEGDSSFSPSAAGCISLVSSGKSDADSEFVEASADGNDVFVNTLSSLVAQDYGLRDIYDARVGGGFPPPAEAGGCEGDSCQHAPEPPQASTPSSSSFHGAGNAGQAKARSCARPARRAQKVSRRAKRLRRHARRSGDARKSKLMRRKARRLARRARKLSVSAKRCRRARGNRRAHR